MLAVPAFSVLEPREFVPSRKVTVPVGTACPEIVADTVAFRLTV
jgi:hypothetical protein